MTELDSHPGTYVLVLKSLTRATLTVGRLGELSVQPGYYLYVGSAFGPGGLRARVNHHIAQAKVAAESSLGATKKASEKTTENGPTITPHWHIDYLRAMLPIHEVWTSAMEIRLEHVWAKRLAASKNAVIPLGRFGASDCRCVSHLFYFAEKPSSQIVGAEAVMLIE